MTVRQHLLHGLLDEEVHRLVGGCVGMQDHQRLLECGHGVLELAVSGVDEADVVPCHGEGRRRQRVGIVEQHLQEEAARHLQVAAQDADLGVPVTRLREEGAERVVVFRWHGVGGEELMRELLPLVVHLLHLLDVVVMAQLVLLEVHGPALQQLAGLQKDGLGLLHVVGFGAHAQQLACGRNALLDQCVQGRRDRDARLLLLRLLGRRVAGQQPRLRFLHWELIGSLGAVVGGERCHDHRKEGLGVVHLVLLLLLVLTICACACA
mmetsp:Transcript_2693/g.7435  ORF Transcript_2693/g.7435 Transcript_2693/m.7435 type:complete len:265 (-) Transcript_2693:308-1102(-)